MTIEGDGAARSYTLSFTEPASLADVAMVFTEDKVTVQYQDLSVSVKPETLTDGMAGEIPTADAPDSAGKRECGAVPGRTGY